MDGSSDNDSHEANKGEKCERSQCLRRMICDGRDQRIAVMGFLSIQFILISFADHVH